MPLFSRVLVKEHYFIVIYHYLIWVYSTGHQWTLGLLVFLRNSGKVWCQTEMWPLCCCRGISDPLWTWQEN